ncbi:Sorting nexin-14 [Schistosoma japonicum]|nr:Sorting nexin-14 [Schistosoma japonicum]
MIVFICITLSFTLMGYIFCVIISKCTVNKRALPTIKTHTFINDYLRPRNHLHQPTDVYFDHTKVTLGCKSNAALQSIFESIFQEYIEFWYKPFTSNPDFIIQLKLFLQYACAVIVQRIKDVEVPEFIINRFIPHFFDHVLNILSYNCPDKSDATRVGDRYDESYATLQGNHFQKSPLKSFSEEAVLCAFGDRLHAALYSRQAEVMYLRALVNRLLPFLGMPPSLPTPEIYKSKEPSVDLSHRLRHNRITHNSPGHVYGSLERDRKSPVVSKSASTGALFFQKLMELGCNPSLSSFLIEILSTCVLLPAMDTLANSDFVNHLILLSFSECTNSEVLDEKNCVHVPLLEAYIHDWEKWLSKKSSTLLHLDELLSHQDELYPFMQYMKSVKSIEPLTVVLLMYQINSRVNKCMLLSDACHEISAQLQHILSILQGRTLNIEDDDIDYVDSNHYQHNIIKIRNSSTNFFNVSNEFEELLKVTIKYCSPESITELVNTPQWKMTYQSVCKSVELRFIPMYLESPEYIKHSFGLSHSLSSSALSLNKIGMSPKRNYRRFSQNVGGAQQQTGVFGNTLMNVFSNQSTDGQSFGNLDSTKLSVSSLRRSQRDRFTSEQIGNRSNRVYPSTTNTSSNTTDESIINQHVSGIKHLPETTPQLDLSQCNVYIRGLSRPEVIQPHPRHPLGHIAASAVNPLVSSSLSTSVPNSHSNQTSHLPASVTSNVSLMTNTTIPISSTAVRDLSYRNRISNELNNLIAPSIQNSLLSSSYPLPQLSPQFMFNVVTETTVSGIRKQVAKVTRKYSEFYVLEQKLIEFHGSFITKQLPKRQLTPRTMEFLESKCDVFEAYLQYLVAQPFLRNSKLLYSFLTSNEPFNNNLFELNLGRLVKSVPLKLIKEKGQFLDGFLAAYYLSCHPQPMETANTSNSNLVLTRSKSLSIQSSTRLAATNNMSSDNTNSSTTLHSLENSIHKSISGNFKVDTYPTARHIDYYSRYVLNSPQHKHHGRTSLDHRLRSRIYWNNAGLTYENQKDIMNHSTRLSTVHLSSLSEIILYLFNKMVTSSLTSSPINESISVTTNASHTLLSSSSSNVDMLSTQINSVQDDANKTVDPWDVTNPCWSEALLNGPHSSNIIINDQYQNNNTTTNSSDDSSSCNSETHKSASVSSTSLIISSQKSSLSSCETKMDIIKESSISDTFQSSTTKTAMDGRLLPVISITLHDIYCAFMELWLLIRKQSKIYLRYFLLRISMIFFTYFKSSIDNWLTNYLMHHVYNAFSDENLASVLNNIQKNVFSHSSKNIDMDKSERKEKARIALEKKILNITGLSYFTDTDVVRHQVNQLFDCFQYSKWNKQLIYVLLDQLILELFPELHLNNNNNSNCNGNNNVDTWSII